MRILAAFDSHSYSAGIVSEVAKLAVNTWADVTMLAVQPAGSQAGPDQALVAALLGYNQAFINAFSGTDLPYDRLAPEASFIPGNGFWELSSGSRQGGGRKQLILKIRSGDTTKEILAEAGEQESDLIILGCTKGLDCQWQGEIDLPQKIAKGAGCSVLVIKDKKLPETLICCMDQAHVSQASLEMINQIVTLHEAELKIIGITGPKGKVGKGDVEAKIAEILKYYSDRQINAWIKLIRLDSLEEYVARASREGMIALWMGEKSLLSKIFSRDLVGKLVHYSQSSVLILR